MKATTSPVGGRAPPPRKTPPRLAGSRWPGAARGLLAQFGQFGLLVSARSGTDAVVHLGLLDPGAQGLEPHIELVRHPREHGLVGGVFSAQLEDHPHGPLFDLGRIPVVSRVVLGLLLGRCHCSSISKRRSVHNFQRESGRSTPRRLNSGPLRT
jgi:hypothetical protein